MYAQELTRHYSDIRKRLNQRAVQEPTPPVKRKVVPPSALPFRVSARFAEFKTAAFLVNKTTWDRYAGATVRNIMLACCEYYQIGRADMLSKRRHEQIVKARHVAMYLSRKYTTRSMPEIGLKLGGKDHTTVMHGAAKIERLLRIDDELRNDIDFLTGVIGARQW